MMVEEQAVGCVERGYLLHFLVGEREVENVDILLHTLHVGRLRNDYHVAL